jgi:fatty acid-binding protein DegV
LAVLDAQAPDFGEFLGLLSDVRSTRPLLVGEIGPVIGAHAGRGTIGVAWVTEGS